ncbi:hypothetical protein KQ301_09145 [Synechococcus sp. CS-601]|nr:hypothetical protein [Synechococcus sp. CS-601]
MANQQRWNEIIDFEAAAVLGGTELLGCCAKGCQEVRKLFAFGFFEQLNNGAVGPIQGGLRVAG